MRWKNMILGALITLCITVIGSVAAYYLTRQKSATAPTEKLVYQIEKPTTFETEATKRSFLTVRAGNLGNKTASEVRIGIQFDIGILLLDKKITISTEPVGTFEDRSSAKNRVDLFVPTLIAGEIVAVAMMLDGVVRQLPTVGVRSANSSGKLGSFVREVESEAPQSKLALLIISIFLVVAATTTTLNIPWIIFFEFPAKNISLCTYVPLCKQHRVPLHPSGIN